MVAEHSWGLQHQVIHLKVHSKGESCAGCQGAFIEMVAEYINAEPIIITRACPWSGQSLGGILDLGK